MSTKEYILFAAAIIGPLIAIAALIFGIYQYRKNRQLEKEKLEYERTRDKKLEQKETAALTAKEEKQKTDAELYCEHIEQKFKYLDFTGLNAILQKPLMLETIYVKLRAKRSLALVDYHSIADFQALEKEREREKVSDEVADNDGDFVSIFATERKRAVDEREPFKMVILGSPGSGKTTLMKWIALKCACNRILAISQKKLKKEPVFSQFIPVFIALKDLGRDTVQTFHAKSIRQLTLDRLTQANLSTSFFDQQFEENRVLFLLDGLDEVADEGIRREVIQWIENQNIRKNSLLVTSRFSGLQPAKGLKFHDAIPVFDIRDFDIADIERFLENWYRNIETAVIGDAAKKDKEAALQKGENRFADLMQIIKSENYQNLRQLAVNPLLLTIIAIVHRTRAVLPKERHKLYEECLKVMIELWNVANRKINVTFSVDNSLANLSKLAVFLMKENRREMEIAEIRQLLPAEIEKHPLDFFLKEMVLKAGLLYESEGKYGFLHLTFQEYLAACYFARGGNPVDILEYRERDYWHETFKLYFNIGNARLFFEEIINNLLEKGYWQQMRLWEDSLKDMVTEDSQKEIEMQFARKILDVLPGIEYKEKNEALIVQLTAHYPLYKHAAQFVEKGWQLFHYAAHPFVQSIGSSILYRAGHEPQAQLMQEIKKRIAAFEKEKDRTPERLLDFIYQNNNSFVLLAVGRRNLTDFHFNLVLCKYSDIFIKFLAFLDLLDILYLRAFRDTWAILDLLDLRDILDTLAILDLRAIRTILDLRTIRDLLDILDSLAFLAFLALQALLALRDQYLGKYEAIFKENNEKIVSWADKSIAKLHSMSDEELKKYFPGTTQEELEMFRESKGKDQKELFEQMGGIWEERTDSTDISLAKIREKAWKRNSQ